MKIHPLVLAGWIAAPVFARAQARRFTDAHGITG